MIKQLTAISLLSLALATSAVAQSRSPSGDPTGASTGVASDADPVGKPVGKEPAMIDPHTTGSVELNARAKVDCAKKTDSGKKVADNDTTRERQTACQ